MPSDFQDVGDGPHGRARGRREPRFVPVQPRRELHHGAERACSGCAVLCWLCSFVSRLRLTVGSITTRVGCGERSYSAGGYKVLCCTAVQPMYILLLGPILI
jgi:hypothetical protein